MPPQKNTHMPKDSVNPHRKPLTLKKKKNTILRKKNGFKTTELVGILQVCALTVFHTLPCEKTILNDSMSLIVLHSA